MSKKQNLIRPFHRLDSGEDNCGRDNFFHTKSWNFSVAQRTSEKDLNRSCSQPKAIICTCMAFSGLRTSTMHRSFDIRSKMCEKPILGLSGWIRLAQNEPLFRLLVIE